MQENEEINGVPDESDKAGFGLTLIELKRRLKNIAGLCYALTCDISNVEIEAEHLRKENTHLRACLKSAGVKKFQKPPKEIGERIAAAHLSDYRKQQYKAEAVKAFGGGDNEA